MDSAMLRMTFPAQDENDLPAGGRKRRLKTTKIKNMEGSNNEQGFAARKEKRVPTEEAKRLVLENLRSDRLCISLDESQMEAIIQSTEFFHFKAGSVVVHQGEQGRYFFVLQEGKLEVDVDGVVVNTMESGSCFGANSLLYNCPRTATVRAVVDSGVWGVDGDKFRAVMKEHAKKHYEENRKFLDCVKWFDVLSATQKDSVAELAVITEQFPAGSRVVTEGESPTAVYVVKRGSLSVLEGATMDAQGVLSGGKVVTQLQAGDCFGERAALYGLEKRSCSVVADVQSDLLCMGISQLKELLGDDLAQCLERSLVLAVLHKIPIISHLSLSQRHHIAEAMETKQFAANETLAKGLQLVVVLDGEISSGDTVLKRGMWHGYNGLVPTDALGRADSKPAASQASEDCPEFKVGPEGARIAALSQDGVVKALKQLGLSSLSGASEAIEGMRKVLLAKKVPIFRELSKGQVDRLVKAFAVRKYRCGAAVIEEGEIGDAFFIVANGEVNILLGNEVVRTLGRNACFGERALLLDEPRTAAVKAASEHLELWSVTRWAFQSVVTETMRAELLKRIELQDTTVQLNDLIHVKLIGAGTFGSVRLVEHCRNPIRYALKRIKLKDEKVPDPVIQEIETLKSVDHPFILKMVASFERKTSIYILTELVTGGNLFDTLERLQTVLNRPQAQFYIGSLVLVLEALHEQHIVYRDLKPENVMLDCHGYLKLIDFGLAKKVRITGRAYTVCGTLFYMAPEIFKGKGYGVAVDHWALGVMLYDMMMGHLPFGHGAKKEQVVVREIIRCDLDLDELDDVSAKMLMRSLIRLQPERRLGVGGQGWEEVKKHKFFALKDHSNLFEKLISRELEPPSLPPGEMYTEAQELSNVNLSDSEELCGEKKKS
eukprot:TRINITY_DN31680_c0_g1_i1.p1 TRINITY_DN31680_c0_g1~~TRINITY_DN31680_c0_g1_i1.p1  ORF type:complete len:975 (-),score=246.53 TRINITY_DN31680_c0_g1_i1:76-2736(-)